jgi:hypothetical protein
VKEWAWYSNRDLLSTFQCPLSDKIEGGYFTHLTNIGKLGINISENLVKIIGGLYETRRNTKSCSIKTSRNRRV